MKITCLYRILHILVKSASTNIDNEKQPVSISAPRLEQNSTSVTEEIHRKSLAPKTYGIHLEIPGALQVRNLV